MPPQNSPVARGNAVPGDKATLDQWLGYLESIHPSEIDLGLDRVLLVLRRLFRRNPAGRIITIAGTNGKGSAVAALEKLLMASGRSTGAYTSPHLQNYNERVRINGADVSDDQLVRAFSRVEEARRDTTLTYFEFGTLAAFVLFLEAGVEDWVLEVGLGGRLDAVNVLDPDLAIITSVDIDHVAFLGDNREVIGFEKAGILRPGIPAVYADIDPPESVLQQAAAQKVQLERPGETYQLVPWIGRREPGAGRVIAVYAALEDKDVEGVAGAMAPVVDEWHLAGLDVHRGLSGPELVDRIGGLLRLPAATVSVSVSAAVEEALGGAGPEDMVVIFGSFYTVAQARVSLGRTAP